MKSKQEQKEELAWLGRRKKGIGSSQSPVLVLGKVFDSTPLSVYIDKKTPVVPNTDDNPNFKRGHMYEPVAIDLFREQHPGVKTFMPKTLKERYHTYQSWHPTLPHIYADFDGFCLEKNGDLWVLEVKSPRQMIADRIKAEGLKDYYQVQSHHLCGVAKFCKDLPPQVQPHQSRLKGAKVLVYECENINVLEHQIDYDQEMVDLIFEKDTTFWEENVAKDVPPSISSTPPPVISSKGGKYHHVDGKAWIEASSMLLLAGEMKKLSESRHKAAKQQLIDAMKAAGLDKVILPNGTKLNLGVQNGRKSFDKEMFKAAYPHVDLALFEKVGKSFEAFRVYGKTAAPSEDSLDGAIGDLTNQLENFVKRDLDAELAIEVFEDLQNKTELYQRLLQGELERLDVALDVAATSAIKKSSKK